MGSVITSNYSEKTLRVIDSNAQSKGIVDEDWALDVLIVYLTRMAAWF